MHIEVDCSGRGTTRGSVCVRFFVRMKLLSNFLSIFCIADGCWLDDRGNEGSCKRTTTKYEGGANALALLLNAHFYCQCGCGLMRIQYALACGQCASGSVRFEAHSVQTGLSTSFCCFPFAFTHPLCLCVCLFLLSLAFSFCCHLRHQSKELPQIVYKYICPPLLVNY